MLNRRKYVESLFATFAIPELMQHPDTQMAGAAKDFDSNR